MTAVAWILSLVLAWLLGTNYGPGSADRTVSNRTTPSPRAEADIPPPRTGKAAPDRGKPRPAPPPKPPDPARAESLRKFSLDAKEYVAALLREDRHRELLVALQTVLESGQLQRLEDELDDERRMPGLLYPWLKFLVEHDREMVALLETMYRSAIEDPAFYDGLTEDTVEVFFEALSWVLPGVVQETKLAQFRGYAARILAQSPDRLPEAVRERLSQIKRNLEHWSPEVAPGDALKLVQDANTPIDLRVKALRKLTLDQWKGVDIVPILRPALTQGNHQALALVGKVALRASDLALLDRAFLDGAEQDLWTAWDIRSYLEYSARAEWEQARPFVEAGLHRGGSATKVFAMSLTFLDAPEEFLREALATYLFDDNIKKSLKRRLGD